MLKRNCLILLCTLIAAAGWAQDPVSWAFSAKKTGDKTYSVHITATITDGWHIYAMKQPEAAISIPTKITFTKNPLIGLQGGTRELGKMEKQVIASVGVEQNMYEKTVDFVQDVSLKANSRTAIAGEITFQACTGERCLPPKTISFNIPMQ